MNGDVGLPPMLRNDTALRGRIEDFLYLEADLLDDWKIEEWFALFAEGATYEVPPTGSDENDPATSLFYIADDYVRLRNAALSLRSMGGRPTSPFTTQPPCGRATGARSSASAPRRRSSAGPGAACPWRCRSSRPRAC